MQHATKHVALALALAFGLVGGAAAATQTLAGEHITFSYDDSLLGLFGSPSVSGDTLFFTPTSFAAASSNGSPGLDFKNATINIGITANEGYRLAGVDLVEQGDYLLYRPLGTGALGVDVTGQIRVRDLATLAETTDGIESTAALTSVGSSTTNWTATAGTSFAVWQSQAINLTIENILLAYTTSASSLALIEKKFVGANVLVAAVPEPETYAMLLAGLGLLGLVRRRR